MTCIVGPPAFVIAVPIAALAFLATWLIPQTELRRRPEAGQAAPSPGTAPADRSVTPQPLPGRADPAQAPTRPPVTHETLGPQHATGADP
jgi:hypothetical protein